MATRPPLAGERSTALASWARHNHPGLHSTRQEPIFACSTPAGPLPQGMLTSAGFFVVGRKARP